jgi:hypothetical protein
MIQVFCKGFQVKVLHEEDTTEPFDMKKGVRHGCLLSPLLFLVALNLVARQAFGDEKTLFLKLEDPDFAGDQATR